jgi:hypothetical protein
MNHFGDKKICKKCTIACFQCQDVLSMSDLIRCFCKNDFCKKCLNHHSHDDKTHISEDTKII